MGYMLMQAYDFVHLNKTYGCTLQIGGSDQWGNIVAGIDLGRKMKFVETGEAEEENDMYGLTCPLLMTKDGKKMGKTESGALWVAREKTTTFDFYQYFYNVGDEDVESLLKLFTFKPTDEIEALCTTDIIKAKRTMAYEVTKLVHGEEAADEVIKAVETLYSDKVDYDNVPSIDLEKSLLEPGINILDLLILTNLFSSKGEARRMVQQNGVSINGHKITIEDTLTVADLEDGFIIVQKGKKKFLKLNFI
jgi:tyrosyl-tRNA synthetase